MPISTHSPRAGRTPSVRVAVRVAPYFNSLAPCGANPATMRAKCRYGKISTHSPRAGRTRANNNYNRAIPISTHSPRAGRTHVVVWQVMALPDFNSLAPCGANQQPRNVLILRQTFQLTRPVRGEPLSLGRNIGSSTFQLTRPVRGEPASPCPADSSLVNFNSLAPCGANPTYPFS